MKGRENLGCLMDTPAPLNDNGVSLARQPGDDPTVPPLGSIEDSFATAGLLGLEQPTDVLAQFHAARQRLIEAESRLVDLERHRLDAASPGTAGPSARLQADEQRSLDKLNALDTEYKDLKTKEGELLGARAV